MMNFWSRTFLSEFEEGINRPSKSQTMLHHHEDTPVFQQQFTSYVRRVFTNFSCDHFESEDLAKVSNLNVTYPECVHEALKTLLVKMNLSSKNFGILDS